MVLSEEEVFALLRELEGVYALVGCLLYGSGLRVMEALRLRVGDVDFGRCCLLVRDGKGRKDRVVTLADEMIVPLQRHLGVRRTQWERDIELGRDGVFLPFALERKYPNAWREWHWQYVFASRNVSTDPRSGVDRRHHLHESSVRRALRRAVIRAGTDRRTTCHTLRHCFAPTCSNTALIFAQCRSSSAMPMWLRPRFILMLLIAVAAR